MIKGYNKKVKQFQKRHSAFLLSALIAANSIGFGTVPAFADDSILTVIEETDERQRKASDSDAVMRTDKDNDNKKENDNKKDNEKYSEKDKDDKVASSSDAEERDRDTSDEESEEGIEEVVVTYRANAENATVSKRNGIYKVSLDESDVICNVEGSEADTDSEVRSLKFKNDGYVFREWNTEPDGSGTVYLPGAQVQSTITLYAQWDEDEKMAMALMATSEATDEKWFQFTAGNGTITGYNHINDAAAPSADAPTEVVIPDMIRGVAVTRVGRSAFRGTDVVKVTIPNSVKELGDRAFSGCSSLESVIIPDSVTIIGEDAFTNDSKLTDVTIPNNLKIIKDYAFDGTGLESVDIPNSVTEIGKAAFGSCRSLVNVTIPNSVTKIDEYAFAGCSSLVNITIPNSVTTIEPQVFKDCSALENVNIPDSVTRIGDYCFLRCSSLVNITLPDSVVSIGRGGFGDCSSLKEINLGNSIKDIGEYAFINCSSLNDIELSSNIQTISRYAFNSVNPSSYVYLDVKEGDVAGAPWGHPDPTHIIYGKKPATYTVVFKDGETVLQTESIEEGTDATAPEASTLKKTDYIFVRWDTDFTKVTADLVVNAIYAEDFNHNGIDDAGETHYNVTFTDGEGNTIGDVQSVLENMGATAPAEPKKDNYIFVHWDKEFAHVKGDLVVNAVYAEDFNHNGIDDAGETHYNVTFTDGEGNIIGDVQSVLENSAATAPEAPKRAGYVFVGWDTPFDRVTDNLKVTAIYEKNSHEKNTKEEGTHEENSYSESSHKSTQDAYRYLESRIRDKNSQIAGIGKNVGTWNYHPTTAGWTFTATGRLFANEWAYIYNPYAGKGMEQSSWFRFAADGYMITGFYTDTDGQTYYLNSNSDGTLGAMVTGWQFINGNWYYFSTETTEVGSKGAMLKNTITPDGKLVDINGVWIAK